MQGKMETMGWIDGRRPRMVSVQSEGCAPMVRAFTAGADGEAVVVADIAIGVDSTPCAQECVECRVTAIRFH